LSDRTEGLVALLIALSTMLVVFAFPSPFNSFLSLIYRSYKSLGIAPRSEKSFSARPLVIRVYFGLMIICLLYVMYNVALEGE
jgi:hypothetical protein